MAESQDGGHLSPERVVPESARQDEPAVDGDDEAAVPHLDLLAEVVPQVSLGLVAHGVRHHGQERVHRERQRRRVGVGGLRFGVAR